MSFLVVGSCGDAEVMERGASAAIDGSSRDCAFEAVLDILVAILMGLMELMGVCWQLIQDE